MLALIGFNYVLQRYHADVHLGGIPRRVLMSSGYGRMMRSVHGNIIIITHIYFEL